MAAPLSTKRVRAIRDLGINKGATGPHFMECSDGKRYLVKFADETKTAVNEFLGYALAREIGVPVPPNALVEIPSEIIAASDDMRNREVVPGLHPGSEVIVDAQDFEELEKKQAGKEFHVTNFTEIPGIICLDNWIMTKDRNRKDNHLLQPAETGFRYFTVDFSHSFTGPNWNAGSLMQASTVTQPAPTYSLMDGTITGLASIEPTLNKLESITDSQLDSFIADVPSAWELTNEELEAVLLFLQRRRGMVRGIVTTYLTWVRPGV